MKATGYTIWLMPTGKISERLQEVVNNLAQKYQAPVFNPHITLLGDVNKPEEEVLEKVAEVAKNTKAFKVELHELGIEDYYFRCLFVKVKPTEELTRLREKITQASGENSLPYMPHISLLYGDYPNEVKTEIIKELGRLDFEFVVDKIDIFHAFGEPNEWFKVKEVSLEGSD